MTRTVERLEQKAAEELAKPGFFKTIARPLLDNMLTMLKQYRAENERLTAENARLRNEMAEEREESQRIPY